MPNDHRCTPEHVVDVVREALGGHIAFWYFGPNVERFRAVMAPNGMVALTPSGEWRKARRLADGATRAA